MDQSKKTMRHFYCRDVLWETFEQMANDFDCSIDYLINEAMRYYARSKNYQSAGAGSNVGMPQGMGGAAAAGPGAGGAKTGVERKQPGPPPPPSRGSGPVAAQHPPGHVHGSASPSQRGVPAMNARRPAPPKGGMPAPTAAAGPTLFLIFNNQRMPVDKDQFIIGRGSKTSDLAIKDGNISRKHAAVIRRNGTYYIKDLGSTNGIDYKGMRIDNKRIDEGDVFHLCDYELRFTYSGA